MMLLRLLLRDYEVKTTLSKFARELRDFIQDYPTLSKYLESSVDEFFSQQLPEEVLAHLLIEWIQNYTSDLAGYGFPFDRANLALVKRMEIAHEHLQKLSLKPTDRLMKIKSYLGEVLNHPGFQQRLKSLKRKAWHFDRFRAIFRIAPQDGNEGLNDDGKEVDMIEMKKELEKFVAMEEIQQLALFELGYKKMLAQIKKYKNKLFTDGIEVIVDGKKRRIQPERTNNLMERFFRGEKRGVRKRTGNKSMSQALKTMLAETPYVKNLKNPEYLKVILNGKKTLAERFAEINSEQVRQAMQKHHEDQDRLRPCVKRVIEDDNILHSILEAYLTQRRDCVA